MTDESITIALPLPAKVLAPNSTVATMGGRFMKATAIKRYKRLACEAVEAELVESKPWKRVTVFAAFYHKTKRKRDGDNAIGSLKAAYDGIVDAGLVPDDDDEHMARERPTFAIDKQHPRVELTITRNA